MNEERFTAETKKIQSVIAKASQKAGALSALSAGGKMSREKLQLTLEETAYFFESATLNLRALCATQLPGNGGYGRRDGLEIQIPHISLRLRRSICAPSAKHRCRALADTGGATGWSSSSRPGTLKSRARAGYICSSIRFCRIAGICPRLG